MISDTCKNRNDVACQSMNIERHVCPADTSVQILYKLQAFMLEAGHEAESFPDKIIFPQRHHQLGKSEVASKMCRSI